MPSTLPFTVLTSSPSWGPLHGKQGNQGVFITTARFSSGAHEYVASIADRVVLIDGQRIASLMIRYGVGVQVRRTTQIVEIDEDFCSAGSEPVR
jgi:restriction system protein